MNRTLWGGETAYNLDEKGRTVAIEDSLGNRTTMRYDGHNQVVERQDARANSTQFTYDVEHNLSKITDALVFQTHLTYDPTQHQVTDIDDPLAHNTHFEYDPEHHLKLTRNAEGDEVKASYYANGQLQTAADGRNTVTTYSYDTRGNLDTSQTGSHPIIDYDYDTAGQLHRLIDQVGAVTQFTYSPRGSIKSRTDPLGELTDYLYDDAGQLTSVIDRKTDTVGLTYSDTGKLKTITYADIGLVTYYYDARDWLERISGPLGDILYGYNSAGRLIEQTDPQSFTVKYAYDAAGNLNKLTYPDDKEVSYTYDALNRLETVTTWLSQTATYYYDDAGRLDYRDNFNGTRTEYGYDDANRLTLLTHKKSDGTLIARYAFELDANGNRQRETGEQPITPTPILGATFYDYNLQRNRLESSSSDSFTYDLEGQLENKSGEDYRFDSAHRLTEIGTTRQFYYDGIGNRLKAVRNGVTTRYIYDAAGNLLAEADASNTITRYYVHGMGMLALVEDGQSYSYHHNAIGSTVAITDASETVMKSYAYAAYGQITGESGSMSQPFTYVGEYGVMAELGGLYYMRARYYDPEVGRFISEDPIGFEGGLNLYTYVVNNPINFIDPLGLWTAGLSFNVGGGAGYGLTGGVNFVMGYGENGFSFDMQRIVGGGSYAGANGGFSVNLEVSNADNTSELYGMGYQVGGSGGEVLFVDGNFFGGDGYQGLSLGLGIGGGATPAAGYGFMTHTSSK